MDGEVSYGPIAAVYDAIVVDPCYPQWATYLDKLWAADDVGVSRVLDVCCGTGLLTGELIERGYEVVGEDASAPMLEQARSRLGPDAVLEVSVLPDVQAAGPFDAVTSTFDGLNYLTLEDFRLSLIELHRRLRPGGWIIFDLHTDAMMRYTADNPVVTGVDAGKQFTIRSDVNTEARTCVTTIRVEDDVDGTSFIETHRQFFHSDEDVTAALADAGFGDIRATAEYTPEAVGPASLRATWHARVPPHPTPIPPSG